MIVLLSNAHDVTTDHFAAYLDAARTPFVRLNTEALLDQPFVFSTGYSTGRSPGGSIDRSTSRSTDAWIGTDAGPLPLDAITAIYYRRPVPPQLRDDTPPGIARWIDNEVRSAWGGLLAAAPHAVWVNHPLAVNHASYKPEQLARAADAGLAVPESLITNDVHIATQFCERHAWDVIVKPIGHGEILGDVPEDDYLIYTNRIIHRDVASLTRLRDCPTLFQHHLHKAVDLRVTIVGDDVHAVILHSQEHSVSQIDCRRENMRAMRYTATTLPDTLAAQLVAYVRSYGLVYGAIDLVQDHDGHYWFLELNPAGQWAWLELLGHAEISASLHYALTHPDETRRLTLPLTPEPC